MLRLACHGSGLGRGGAVRRQHRCRLAWTGRRERQWERARHGRRRRIDRAGRVLNQAGDQSNSDITFLTPHVSPNGARVVYNLNDNGPLLFGPRVASSYSHRLTPRDEIDHHLANRGALVQRLDQQTREARAIEAGLQPRGGRGSSGSQATVRGPESSQTA